MTDRSFEFVYLGERLVNGKLYVCVCPFVEGVAPTSKKTYFKQARRSMLFVGWAHKTTGEISGESKEISTINFSRVSALHEVVAPRGFASEMRMEQQQHRTRKNMEAKARSDAITKDIDALVRSIRSAMNKTNHAGKAAIMALVIERLTK